MGRRPKEDLSGKATARTDPQCTKWTEDTAWPDRQQLENKCHQTKSRLWGLDQQPEMHRPERGFCGAARGTEGLRASGPRFGAICAGDSWLLLARTI